MLESAKKAFGDRRVQVGALLAVQSGMLIYVLTFAVPVWLIALVSATFGAQIINFANLVRLGTVTDLLAETQDLQQKVRARHEEALKLIEDIEGADAIAVLKDGKVINSHVIRIHPMALH